jgi:hypothetical protein
MGEFSPHATSNNANDVKTSLSWPFRFSEVMVCRFDDSGLFVFNYRLPWRTIVFTAPHFNFDENHGIISRSDDINFGLSKSPVAFKNGITLFFEEGRSHVFACCSQCIVIHIGKVRNVFERSIFAEIPICMRTAVILCVMVLSSFVTSAQEGNEVNLLSRSEIGQRENQFYFYWGYNRASYNPSDISFKGEGYDFKLENVRAHDLPERWNPKVYFNPKQLTIPQFNFRVGYFLNDKYSISLGWDHMKYRIDEFQRVKMHGEISSELSEEYGGVYDGQYTVLDPKRFITIEHTDGFNFVRAAIERQDVIARSKNGKHGVCFTGALSIGAMFPWTDFTLFGERNRNFVHLAGYGASVHTGVRFEFFNYGFLQYASQLGWVNMPDIILEGKSQARASQKITFHERSIVAGAYIPIQRKNS